MKRTAFSLIELMIVISIIAIIAAIAIPNLIAYKNRQPHRITVGDPVVIKAVHTPATVVWAESDGRVVVYTCRVDNGVGATVRFTEIRFFANEIEYAPEK